jgi:hypothetical protein
VSSAQPPFRRDRLFGPRPMLPSRLHVARDAACRWWRPPHPLLRNRDSFTSWPILPPTDQGPMMRAGINNTHTTSQSDAGWA